MSDTIQIVIVTLVTAAALLVLLRPLLRQSNPSGKATGCEHCAHAQTHGAQPPAGDAGPVHVELRRSAGPSSASR